jgi:hypothetical protein
MGLKRELCNLRQGHRFVADYIDVFNNLACYAPDDVNTDASRRERFLDGLSDDLALQLSVVHAPGYQTLLDKARIPESKQQHQIESQEEVQSWRNTWSHQKTRNSYEGNGNSRNRHGGHSNHSHEWTPAPQRKWPPPSTTIMATKVTIITNL